MEDHRLAGFTLFELLITLAVIGILAGLALPAFHNLILNTRLRTAAEIIADDFREARRNAILQNSLQQIQFQYQTSKQWSYSSGTSAQLKIVKSTDFPNIALSMPAFSGQALIKFSPVRGIVNGGRLNLNAPTHRSISVILSPLGRVRLCSNNDTRYVKC